MNRRTKSSLLWGLIGAMTFVVLAQGYVILVGSLPIRAVGMATIGFLIGVGVAATSYVAEPWLVSKGRT